MRISPRRISDSARSNSTDQLWQWSTPRHIERWSNGHDLSYTLHRQVLISCEELDPQVHLLARPRGFGSAASVQGELTVLWQVTSSTSQSLPEMVSSWVGPLQDLVSFLTLRPNRVTEIHGRPDGTGDALPIYLYLTSDSARPRDSTLRMADQLLPLSELSDVCGFIGSWIAEYQSHREVVARLLGVEYAPFVYQGHRVASIVQAAEALHRKLWDHPIIGPTEHKARVRACVKAVPVEHRIWVRKVLGRANQLSFPERVREIVEQASVAGMPLQPGDPDEFAGDVAKLRNAPAHGAGSGFEISKIHWLSEGLYWQLRSILLAQHGVDALTVRRRLSGNSQFRYVAQRLDWVVTQEAQAEDARPTE